MPVETLADVALELNSRYWGIEFFLKKGEKSKTFTAIMESLFNQYGQQFGFEDFSSFKSSIVQVKNNLKRTKKRTQRNLELKCGIDQDSAFEPKKRKINNVPSNFKRHFRRPKEGDGEVFSDDQIHRYELNLDSYWY